MSRIFCRGRAHPAGDAQYTATALAGGWTLPEVPDPVKLQSTGDVTITGAMLPPRSNACFYEADLVVLNRTSDSLYIVRNGENAERLSQEDWAALVRLKEAMSLCEHPFVVGDVLWRFNLKAFCGRTLPPWHPLANCEVNRRADIHLAGMEYWLVNRTEGTPVLQKWTGAARERALYWMHSGFWDRALEFADAAFLLSRELDPQILAMLVMCYTRTGRTTRAAGYLQMATNSKGCEFRRRTEAHVRALETEISS